MHLPPFDGLCTVTLQGGGVFGFSLLGQLKAVDDFDGLRPVAYAGASAGGLIATLRWLGLEPTQIKEELSCLVDDRERLAGLLGSSARDPTERWSADPRIVVKVRDCLLRLFGLETRSGGQISKNISIIKDLAFLATQRGTAAKAWRMGGLFAADGFVEWLDNLLRDRLREQLGIAKSNLEKEYGPESAETFDQWLAEIGIPPLHDEAFSRHRPRFVDFDLARYVLPSSRGWPALVLSVTSLSRREPLFVDSYSAAFEHLPIADAVRATIAFPFVFQPRQLAIVEESRDSETMAGSAYRPATREAILSVGRLKQMGISRELFIDGGVMANFPIWAVARYLRQTLYGHSGERESIRLAASDIEPGVPPFRERMTKDGISVFKTQRVIADEEEIDVPLRALAFRPMLHLGLRLIDPRADQIGKASIGNRIVALLTTGARSYYENLALADGGRLVLTEQLANATGWTHGLLDFDKLTRQTIDGMYQNGVHYAHSRISRVSLQVRLPSAPALDAVLRIAAAGAKRVFAEVLAKQHGDIAIGQVSAILSMLDGKVLKQSAKTSLSDDPVSREYDFKRREHILEADIGSPELYCYAERCAIIAFPAWWWTELEPHESKPAASIVFPIVDLSVGTKTQIAVWCESGIERINDSMYALTERMNAVLFGTLTINVYASAEGTEKTLWDGLISAATENDEVVLAGLRMLQIHVDRVSAMVTEALSRASSEWAPVGPRRKRPRPPEPQRRLVGLSHREADILHKFYGDEADFLDAVYEI